jgi:hypothetical protein
MNNISSRRIYIWAIIILLAGNIAWGFEYMVLKSNYEEMESTESKSELNNQILTFTKMFVNEVLKTNKEVDFDTRLKLENAVRDTKDEEILVAWKMFIDSKTEIEAQKNVKNLLGILISKIKV